MTMCDTDTFQNAGSLPDRVVNCCTTFRYKGLSSQLLCDKKYHISGSKIGRQSDDPNGHKSKVKVPLGLWDSPQLAARFQAALPGLWFVTLELWLSRTLKTVNKYGRAGHRSQDLSHAERALYH